MITQHEFLENTGPTLNDSETCENAEATISSQLTLFAADSLARMLALLERDSDSKEREQPCGQSSPESLAKLSPDGFWLKTYQDYFQATMDGSLEEYSGTWPRAGMMRNGTVYRRQPLVPHTLDTGSSLWLTANAWDGRRGPSSLPYNPQSKSQKDRTLSNYVKWWRTPTAHEWKNTGAANQIYLSDQVRPSQVKALNKLKAMGLWPTLQSRDWKGQSQRGQHRPQDCLPHAINGQLNPMWVEALMGFPCGWTDIAVKE